MDEISVFNEENSIINIVDEVNLFLEIVSPRFRIIIIPFACV